MRILAVWAVLVLANVAGAEIMTKEVSYTHGDVRLKGFLAYDNAKEGKRPGVLVVHEWWGNNDYSRQRARQLAELGYVAFAVDMYGDGKLAKSPQEARGLATPFYEDRALMRERAGAGLKALQEQPTVDGERLAAIGYCFGGSVVLELARSGAPLAAVVSFHGGLATPNPDDARNIKAKVLVLTGGADPMVAPEERDAFIKEMEDARVDYAMTVYGGAKHGFTSPDADRARQEGVGYQKEADQRSWAAMRALFEETLGAAPASVREMERVGGN
jgi:dienelactone hydrolase